MSTENIIWEFKSNSQCAVGCSPPNICFTPVLYTAPDLCVPPGVNPNSLSHYHSFSNGTLILLFGMLLLCGLIIGMLLVLLIISCRRSLRPKQKSVSIRQNVNSRLGTRTLSRPSPLNVSGSMVSHV